MLRNKALALMLGTSGIGLAGIFASMIEMVSAITGLGIANAGVRQIADAIATGDKYKVAKTVRILRYASIISGAIGTIAVAAACNILSHMAFGSSEQVAAIVIISGSILFGSTTAGQNAILQGFRHLPELSKCSILGAVFGAGASIGCIWLLGEKGIPLYILTGFALTVLPSWWYVKKIDIEPIRPTAREILFELRSLLGVGAAFVSASVLTTGSAYLIRILVKREMGLDAVGLYSATVTLSSMYVGMILSAMGADFYPRLTCLRRDNEAMNRLVNEQIEMGLAMAVPGIIATLSLAPLILRIIYSEAFVEGANMLRWQTLGVALRVVCWPMGFVLLAKGLSGIFIAIELIASVLHIALILGCLNIWGLSGLGIAFFALYLAYLAAMLCVCRRITYFHWSSTAANAFKASCVLIIVCMYASCCLPKSISIIVGLLLALMAGVAGVMFIRKSTM